MLDESPTTAADRLDLADWRRRVAALYVAVRERSRTEPRAAWELWRTEREALYRDHPQSPVPAAARPTFQAAYWPYDPALRLAAPLIPPDAAPADSAPGAPGGGLALPMSVGTPLSFSRIGRVRLPLPGGERELGVYWMAGYSGGLFLPFRDATNGFETYGAGRYLLDTAKSADLGVDADGRLILDFNFAFQPSCAFDPKWSCPLAPPDNRLDLRIEAGERLA